jgi:uncharacterized membrane protein YkvA (DUF1232 family)
MLGADKCKDDPQRAAALLDVAAKKATQPGGVRGLFADIKTLIALVRAYFDGSYRAVSWKTIAVALGAVIYFVAPIDGLPDFIPFVGYIDDAFVVALLLKRIRTELDAFRAQPPASP